MTRKQKIWLVIAAALPEIILIAVAISRSHRFQTLLPSTTETLVGSVLAQNSDPARQIPLAGVSVTARAGDRVAVTRSDPSGFFRVSLRPRSEREGVVLSFECPDYKPLQMNATAPLDQLYIARMLPVAMERGKPTAVVNPAQSVTIKNIRVRYSYKDESTVGVGSLAKQFAASNVGNVPCRKPEVCSPDGRWKATRTDLSLDAGEGNEFRNVRISCIAGPCAFTKVDPDHFGEAERRIKVSVLNWSDSADFLVEADITRKMVTDAVRISYPFIVGDTLSFALPPSSEGPSFEADLDGQYIVFPLGPALIVSWSTCSVEVSGNGDKLYRCQSKPGYRLEG
jgi:hypothetical protein